MAVSLVAFGRPTVNNNPAPAPQPKAQVAQTQTSSTLPPASASMKKEKVDVFTQLKLRAPAATDKVYRVDGMSSQPWSRMIGPHPGISAFPQPETANPGFDLLSFSW
jgi:hypothetical protein